MKAILVFEMPESCIKCPLIALEKQYVCKIVARWCGDERDVFTNDTKPNWCPLKEMPMRISPVEIIRYQTRILGDSSKVVEVSDEYCKGWNDCLEEIEE